MMTYIMTKIMNKIRNKIMRQDDIKYLLGEINGKLDGICQRLNKINGTIAKHEDKINDLETFRDNLQGRMSVISATSGFIGGIISLIIHYLNK